MTHISRHGLWLLHRDTEYFLPFEDFPWFAEQPVKAILNVDEPAPNHFHWPDIDVDLTADMIEHPDRYPLKSRR